jgi:hypothetical protein
MKLFSQHDLDDADGEIDNLIRSAERIVRKTEKSVEDIKNEWTDVDEYLDDPSTCYDVDGNKIFDRSEMAALIQDIINGV